MGLTFLLHRPGGSLLLISLAVILYSSELSLEIFSQHVCLLSCAVSTPDPREFLDHITLSHLLHRPACISTPVPLENKDRGQNRTGQEGTAGQGWSGNKQSVVVEMSWITEVHLITLCIHFKFHVMPLNGFPNYILPLVTHDHPRSLLMDVVTRLFGLPLWSAVRCLFRGHWSFGSHSALNYLIYFLFLKWIPPGALRQLCL